MMTFRLVLYISLMVMALLSFGRRQYVTFSISLFLALLLGLYLARQYFLV